MRNKIEFSSSRRSGTLLAALICTITASAATAQGTPTEAAVPELRAVVVSASRSETRLQDMPLHTTVITQEDIQKSPAQTLDQVLRNVPGLLVPGSPFYTTDPTGHNIKFRGMDKKVLVLVDGVPVLDPFYTTIQWFKVPLSSVERVEIIRGGGSSLWGNLAVGGVINIVSKRPTAGDGDARAGAGGLNTWTGGVSKNYVVSERLSFTVTGDMFKTSGYNNAPEGYRGAFWPGRGNSSAYNENIRVAAFFNPLPDLNGFLRAGYHDQNEDIGGYLYGTNLQKSPDLQAGLNKKFDENNRVQANYYAQWVKFDKYNGAGCYTRPTFDCGAAAAAAASPAQQASTTLQYASSHDWNTYRERGGSLMYSRNARGLLTSMQLGMDYRLISGEDDQQSYQTPTAALPQVLRLARTNYGAGQQQFTGAFGQFKLSPLEPLEISLSTRWDNYKSSNGVARQSNYTNVAAPVVSSSTGGPVPDVSKSAFNPNLSVRYDISERLDLRGSVYKAFRAPGLNNMYRSFGSSSISVANPLLGPETLLGREIGADWRGGNYSLGATLFNANVKDVVTTYTITPGSSIPQPVLNICGAAYTGVANTACPGTVSFYTNGQDQQSKGLELDGKWTINSKLTLDSYFTRTLTYFTSTSTGDPTNKQLQLVPKNVAGVNLTWRPTDRWSNYFELRHNGAMTLNLTSSLVEPVWQGGYTTFNLSTAYRFNKDLEWYASVVNLGDKQYTDSSASNPQSRSLAMPRTLMTGMKVRF
jgi:outer membrane receptor protein involved in Fe transport